MKYTNISLAAVFFFLISLASCKRYELEPVNIFSPLPLEKPLNLPSDTINSDSISPPVIFDQQNSEQTADGYHLKGTLYSKNIDSIIKYGLLGIQGSYPIATGEFYIILNSDGTVEEINGNASPVLPDIMPFTYFYTTIQFISPVRYATGIKLKQDAQLSSYPLMDNIHYFLFSFPEANQSFDYGEQKVSNTVIDFKKVFIDPLDPMFLFDGSVSLSNGKSEFSLPQTIIGISAHSNLPFTPLEYTSTITNMVDDEFFSPFNGQIFLSGTIPLDKISKVVPLEFKGQIVIQDNNMGMDFFTEGPLANFTLGGNGIVYLTHDVLQYLPVDMTVQLGQATVEIANYNNFDLRFAGQYGENLDQNPIIAMIGKKFSYLFESFEDQGHVIAYYRSTNDFLFYFDSRTAIHLPAIGDYQHHYTTFAFSPDSVKFYTEIYLPFGIATQKFTGFLDLNTYDFEMSSYTSLSLEIKDVQLPESDLTIIISNKVQGALVHGSMNLGYNIADVTMDGTLTTEELTLQGDISSDIDFGRVKLPSAQMHAIVSTKLGIIMEGKLVLPYGIGAVDVRGEILKDQISLTGHFSTNIEFPGIPIPASNMLLSASSNTGVIIAGSVTLPYGIGQIAARGELTTEKLALNGSFSSHLQFNGFDFPAINMGAHLSSDPAEGVSIYGNINLPSGLGSAYVSGVISSQKLDLRGSLNTNLDLGFTRLSNSLSVVLSTQDGVRFYGNVNFPFGFGGIYVAGRLATNGALWLNGSMRYKIKFTDDVYAEARINTHISNHNVGFNASGNIHIGKETFSVSIDVNTDWSDGSMTFTVHTDLGTYTVTVDKNGKNIKTGEIAVIPLN